MEQTATVAPIMTMENLDTQFSELYTQVNSFSKNIKVMQDDLKALNRTFKQVDKQSKQRKKKPQAKLSLSSDLEKFLSLDHGEHRTKAEVMKLVSTYIKEKNLQIQTDKRKFLPNKELSKIFGVKKPQNMTFVEINKHVSHHLTKLC
jgi:chromatin remodeling complex protein RSC6